MERLLEKYKSVPAGELIYTFYKINVPNTVVVIQSIRYHNGRYKSLSDRAFNPTQKYPTLEHNVKRALRYYKID